MTTQTEAVGSLTGFDEIAIDKHFGFDLYQAYESKPLMATRALVFCDLRHGGVPDKDAHQQAMSMRQSELMEYFEPEPEDVLPEEPDSEPGKGG